LGHGKNRKSVGTGISHHMSSEPSNHGIHRTAYAAGDA